MDDDYEAMLNYVRAQLTDREGTATEIDHYPFRQRTEHCWRIFQWAQRLAEGPFTTPVDRDSLLTAALFHDVGYALLPIPDDDGHAEKSAAIFEEYAAERRFDKDKQDFTTYLIRSHSQKALLNSEGTPLELVLLMEADLLDETGAMSIVWDCMAEGGQTEQSFAKTYQHILRCSAKCLANNPMRTEKARAIWGDKQALVREFLRHLARDLGGNNCPTSAALPAVPPGSGSRPAPPGR